MNHVTLIFDLQIGLLSSTVCVQRTAVRQYSLDGTTERNIIPEAELMHSAAAVYQNCRHRTTVFLFIEYFPN